MFKVYEFHWKAVDRFQQKRKGKQLAQSQTEIEKALIAKGYSHIKISRNFVIPSNPQTEEITQFIAQLALLIQSAIPLRKALLMMLETTTNIRFYQWLKIIIQQIEAGFTFSGAIHKQQKFFQPQEIQLIKMGEASGQLATMLTNIATNREKSEKLAKKVKKIMFYPTFVLGISITLSLALLIFIVPQFVELYAGKTKALPLIISILFSLSNFLRNNATVLITFVLLAVIFLLIFAKKSTFLTACKYAILNRLPVFNQIIEFARIVFFSQNLALMLKAHIRLDAVLNAFLSEKSNDPIFQKEVQFTLTLLKQGYKFSESLNPAVFNQQMVQMIAIGEQSGNLAQMCEHISDIYQQQLDFKVDILSQMLEPLLMLVMGVFVGTIIVGLYLPIFDMGGLVE